MEAASLLVGGAGSQYSWLHGPGGAEASSYLLVVKARFWGHQLQGPGYLGATRLVG